MQLYEINPVSILPDSAVFLSQSPPLRPLMDAKFFFIFENEASQAGAVAKIGRQRMALT
jgi:hypothetical protein